MITIVLVEPQNPGNVGAIARLMKNFGLKELILINPKCKPTDLDALSRAKHAREILKKAKIKDFSYLNNFDYLIATTAALGTDYNIPRSPITPEELAEKVSNNKPKIAILFGREGIGLKNEEILKCDFVVSVPSSTTYPTLNISHAAAIIFYELFKKSKQKKLGNNFPSITKKEKQVILEMINKTIDQLDFSTEKKKETQRKLWKRIIGKAMLTKREAFALLGFFRKLKKTPPRV